MALTINDPELETALAEQARQKGLRMEDYLKQLLRATKEPQANRFVELPRLKGRVISSLSRRELYEDVC